MRVLVEAGECKARDQGGRFQISVPSEDGHLAWQASRSEGKPWTSIEAARDGVVLARCYYRASGQRDGLCVVTDLGEALWSRASHTGRVGGPSFMIPSEAEALARAVERWPPHTLWRDGAMYSDRVYAGTLAEGLLGMLHAVACVGAGS